MPIAPTTVPPSGGLARVVGVPGAVFLGLGSILGTGIFVGLGVAAGAAGPGVLGAIVVAAAVAVFNGLSSAQLAARQPTSGGTYEYARRRIGPWTGFAAGWMFLCAKSASAATAALGIAGYLFAAVGVHPGIARVAVALAVVLAVTLLVLGGLRRSATVNVVIVALTLLALGVFVAAAGAHATNGTPAAELELAFSWGGFLEASALIFVAYTGYGRVATLGEEIRDPERSIPRAIVITLIATAAIYLAVGAAALALASPQALAATAAAGGAPLAAAARAQGLGAVAILVDVAAVTAMAGVLLNLVLGLSRVLLAMARAGDAPTWLSRVDVASSSPRLAVIAVGTAIAALALVGDVGLTWSFSAFTVLVYYAITNAAALRLVAGERLYPRAIAWCGLTVCLGLAFFVETRVWLVGLAVLGAGLALRALALRRRRRPSL